MKTNSTNPSSIFLGYAVDVVAPMALFFVLSRLGVPPIWSLLLGSAIVLVSMTINTVRQRRMDRVGILVLVEIAVSIVLLFVWRDPRFLLAKPSLYTAIAGVYLIATSFRGRPLTYDGAFQIGTKGDPVRGAAFARAWERSSRFRTILRATSLGWGLACLIDAALRVLVVYRFSMNRAAWLANVPHLGIFAVLMGSSALLGRRLRRIVEGELVEMKTEPASLPSAPSSVARESRA